MTTKVEVHSGTIVLPTYPWGAYSDEAPLHRGFTPRSQNIYPYKLQEKIEDSPVDTEYETVVLENDFLVLTFIPVFNGRLYSAYDKINKAHLFYNNPQIKPALFGLRGAWCANGVECNFPNSHSTTTLEPVKYEIIEHDDGAVSFLCGNCERVSRMLWSLEVTLRPGTAAVQMFTKLYNCTETPKPYYYWLNAAVPLYDGSQFIYPESTTRLYTHPPMDISRIAYVDYPVHQGCDISRFSNIPQHFPIFAEKMKEDFFGIYHHDKNSGLAHVADHSMVRGRKIWLFGNARDGRIWIDKLTDSGIDYCELQTGPFSLQSDYRLMMPNRMYAQTDTWLPVGNIGGFNSASDQLVANIAVSNQECLLKLNPVCDLNGAKIILSVDEKQVAERELDFSAMEIVELDFAIPSGKRVECEILNERNNTILTYQTEMEPVPVSRTPRGVSPARNISDAKDAFLEGNYWEEQGFPVRAYGIYSKDDHVNSIVACAKLDISSGLYEKAATVLQSVLEQGNGNAEAFYYLALCKKALHRFDEAEELLSLCGDNLHYLPDALLLLAEISVMRNDYQRASQRIGHCIGHYHKSGYAEALRLLIHRKLMPNEEHSELVQNAVDVFAYTPLLRGEMLISTDGQAVSEYDSQSIIEIVCSYIRLVEYDDAQMLLGSYMDQGTPESLLCYYAGFLEDRLNDRGAAKKQFKRAAELDDDMEFVSRLETEAVLKTALSYEPGDEKAMYHIANLYASKHRWDDALPYFRKIESELKPYALRNEALYLWKSENNLHKAAELYKRASQCENVTSTMLGEYDKLLAELGQHDARIRMFDEHRELVENDDRLMLRKIDALVVTGDPSAALDLLMNNRFSLCEGRSVPRILYEEICYRIGQQALESGDYKAALRYFKMPFEYPEQLGVGKPAANQEAEWCWRCACVCELMEKKDEAKKYFQMGLPQNDPTIKIDFFPLKRLVKQHDAAMIELPIWINEAFRAECAKKLGDDLLLEEIVHKMAYTIDEKVADGVSGEPELNLLRAMLSWLTGQPCDHGLIFDHNVIPFGRILKTIGAM